MPGSRSSRAAGSRRAWPTCSLAMRPTRSTRSTRSASPGPAPSGDACVATAGRALRGGSVELRDGEYDESRRRGGHELVWFPEPIGPRECERVATGVHLLSAAVPDASRISVRFARDETGPRQRWLRKRDPDGTWGAVRVEVWGRRGAGREPIVYGAIERTAIAAGTVLGVTAAALAGALPGLLAPSAGRVRPGRGGPAPGLPRRAVPPRGEGRDLRRRPRRLTRRFRKPALATYDGARTTSGT